MNTIKVIKKHLYIAMWMASSCSLLSCCIIKAKPICKDEWYQQAQKEICEIFARQAPVDCEMDFNEALARGLQYNLDQRVYEANIALKFGAARVAQYAMFPELDASGSIYARNNSPASFGSDANGHPTDQIITGADKTIRTWRLGPKWNLLDLGRGYVKAREESEKILIAEEESRGKLQKLVQELRVAYWKAYNAQQLRTEYVNFQSELSHVKNQISESLQDNTIPKIDILNFHATLLDANRRLVQIEDKFNKAELQFKFLINVPANQPVNLKQPPLSISKIQNLRNLDFVKLDAITLVNRPELRSQNYQRRIAELGTKAAILQALPSLTLNGGRNFSSNSFLVNNFWSDMSIETSWNIFSLAALPVTLRNAEAQIQFESFKLMALTLGALNETRIAFAHYQTLAREARVAHKQTENAKKTYKYVHDREKASLASPQQVMLAKLQYLFTRMDEIMLLADLSTALGDLYLASGFDVLPLAATRAAPCEVIAMINKNLALQENFDFKCYVNLTYEKLFANNEDTL